jgi:hypothetical protein
MTTNGTHGVTDPESPERADQPRAFLNGQTVDERLAALLQTIRTWDWRAAVVEAGSPPLDVVAKAVPLATTTTSTRAPEDSESRVHDPSPLQDVQDTQPVVNEPMPRPATRDVSTDGVGPTTDVVAAPVDSDSPTLEVDPFAEGSLHEDSESLVPDPPPFQDIARTQPVVMEPTPGPEAGDPPTVAVGPIVDAAAPPFDIDSPPVEVDPFAERMLEETGVDLTSWFGHQSEPEHEPEHEGLIRRVWSHRTTKLAVLAVATVVVVILIIGGIRLFAKSPGSAGTTATTVIHPQSRPHPNQVVAPINSAQMAQFRGYAAGLQSANVAATRGFIQAGSTPTASQVVLVVGAYRTAVNLYNYQLYLIHWPASMQTAIETDHAQLQALTSFLQAFSSVAPNGVPAWLSQLHNRASSTEAADNSVRQTLDLSASSSFP